MERDILCPVGTWASLEKTENARHVSSKRPFENKGTGETVLSVALLGGLVPEELMWINSSVQPPRYVLEPVLAGTMHDFPHFLVTVTLCDGYFY